MFIIIPVFVLLIANFGIRVLLSAVIPQISYLTSLWICSSVSLLFFTLVILAFMFAKRFEHELMLKRMNSDEFYDFNDEDEEADDYEDDEDYDHEEGCHTEIEYDKDGRPYCSDCRAYQDEKGGYYAANREERRALKKLGLE